MIKHTPATPLPWTIRTRKNYLWSESDRSFPAETGGPNAVHDAAYIAHAANAYPRLVEALRSLCEPAETPMEVKAAALLKELGE